MSTQSSYKYSINNKSSDKSKKIIKSNEKQCTNSNEPSKSIKNQHADSDEPTKSIKKIKNQFTESDESMSSKSKENLDKSTDKDEMDINELEPTADNNFNKDTSFILKRNKKSGNFSILRKITKSIAKHKNQNIDNDDDNDDNDDNNDNDGKSKRMCGVQRAKYTVYGAYLPFGREEYNNNLILNAVVSDSTNFNHNLIVTLKQVIKAFENLRDTEQGRYKYAVNDKKFFSFMKELKSEDENNKLESNSENKQKITKYQLRLYLRYGAKVIHAKHVGELSYNQLKGKWCNLDLELGSMWVNANTMQYGINIHVTRIVVLN